MAPVNTFQLTSKACAEAQIIRSMNIKTHTTPNDSLGLGALEHTYAHSSIQQHPLVHLEHPNAQSSMQKTVPMHTQQQLMVYLSTLLFMNTVQTYVQAHQTQTQTHTLTHTLTHTHTHPDAPMLTDYHAKRMIYICLMMSPE